MWYGRQECQKQGKNYLQIKMKEEFKKYILAMQFRVLRDWSFGIGRDQQLSSTIT
jgi:hypothetical protein